MVILWLTQRAWMRVTITNVIHSVGHLRSDSVDLLIMDSSVHIKGTDYVSQVPQDNVNLAGNGLKSWVF
jgi:hypothetical protein